MNKTKMAKKIRKYARQETKQFIDNVHTQPFKVRLKFAIRLIFGRAINKGKS